MISDQTCLGAQARNGVKELSRTKKSALLTPAMHCSRDQGQRKAASLLLLKRLVPPRGKKFFWNKYGRVNGDSLYAPERRERDYQGLSR